MSSFMHNLKLLVNPNWSYSPETLNWVKIDDVFFLSRVTLKFDGWPWKTIWHLYYTMSSCMHHFKPLVNSNWSNSPESLISGQDWRFFFAVWPWNLTDDIEKPYSTSSILYQVECIISNHWWIQTGVTVQKLSKLAGFFAAWLWNLTDDIEKQ